MKRTVVLSVGLWSAFGAQADEKIHQMLPLAVGNNWEYQHGGIDTSTNTRFEHWVTISITHTEDIEGHTYYVFSDMPYGEPSVPHFFIAGKKVRWEGDHLLFRQQDRDVALYQFGGHPANDKRGSYDYIISGPASDTMVKVGFLSSGGLDLFRDDVLCLRSYDLDALASPLPWQEPKLFIFNFMILAPGERRSKREASFIQHYGMNDVRDSGSTLFSYRGVINGVKFEFRADPTASAKVAEFPCGPSAIRALSWGVLKKEFIHLSNELGDLK